MHCTGILLAAGRGRRYDPTGVQNKLLQCLPDGEAVALHAAMHLRAVLPETLIVLHPDADLLKSLFEASGFNTTFCPNACEGMGHSLAHAIQQTADARGWIIALADMPQIKTTTIAALDTAIQHGADIAVPVYQNLRGNPVGFSSKYRDALLQLTGDRGARHLLASAAVTEVVVQDAGIFFDIDSPADLQKII